MQSIIELVQQTMPNNCASASIAMVLKESIEAVTNDFHDGYMDNELDPHDYFSKKGVKFRRCMAAERKVKPGHVYIVCVPSLNIKSGTHYIVAECVDEGWYLFDPNDGKEGKFSYSNIFTEDDLFSDIVSWEPHYEFKIEDLKEYWGHE